MIFDKLKLYCLKCHNEYPYPRYSNSDKMLELDGWVFLTINKTKYSISNLEREETEMICPLCKEKISLLEIALLRKNFIDWLFKMRDGEYFEKIE